MLDVLVFAAIQRFTCVCRVKTAIFLLWICFEILESNDSTGFAPFGTVLVELDNDDSIDDR